VQRARGRSHKPLDGFDRLPRVRAAESVVADLLQPAGRNFGAVALTFEFPW
jgi:hypothetical protein